MKNAVAMSAGFWSFEVRPEFSESMNRAVKAFVWFYLVFFAVVLAATYGGR